jgi:cytidylate kinase
VLGSFADVLHVRLQAPFPARVARVMAQQKMTAEQAEAAVKGRDKVRMAFVEDFYRVSWGTIHAFDLVINTAKISPDLAFVQKLVFHLIEVKHPERSSACFSRNVVEGCGAVK